MHMNIGTLLPRHARYRPDHLAVVFAADRLTFRQFNARVNRLANGLLAAGLAKGDKMAVSEAAVFGIQDPRWGETPVAAVILHEPEGVGARELVERINARVGAKFQRVSDVMIVEDFPRNVAGKTLKRVLQEQYTATGRSSRT